MQHLMQLTLAMTSYSVRSTLVFAGLQTWQRTYHSLQGILQTAQVLDQTVCNNLGPDEEDVTSKTPSPELSPRHKQRKERSEHCALEQTTKGGLRGMYAQNDKISAHTDHSVRWTGTAHAFLWWKVLTQRDAVQSRCPPFLLLASGVSCCSHLQWHRCWGHCSG